MDAKTLEALKASIKHWEENCAAEKPSDVKINDTDCALCQTFKVCNGCPVAEKTGIGGCIDTPYYDARTELGRWRFAGSDSLQVYFRIAAAKELAFLRSLLPEEEPAS